MRSKLSLIIAISAAVITLCAFGAVSYADDGDVPIYAADITDGTYSIEVDSSSSMFKVVDCQLTVSGDSMTAVMTMSGQGYGYLFMGTGEEALSADESLYIPFVLDAEGQKTFTVPVSALDTTVKCAAWSIKKESWYDRDLVFRSDNIPDGSVTRPSSGIGSGAIAAIAAAVIAAAAAVTAVTIAVKKKKNSSKS